MNTSGSVERHVQDTIVPSLFDIRYTALDLRYSISSADNMIAGKVKQNNYDYTSLLRMQAMDIWLLFIQENLSQYSAYLE